MPSGVSLTLPETELVVRLAVAALLGGAIGLERERLERAAGLRTHALVSVASALMMIVSAYGFAGAVLPGREGALDPSRLAAQVISGIGFLGAGVIIFQKNRVRGLDTAASIWAVAGIGLAAGGGLYLAAGLGTLFVVVIQGAFRVVERRFFAHNQEHRLSLLVKRGGGRIAAVERALAACGAIPRRVRLREEEERSWDRLDLDLSSPAGGSIGTLIDALRLLDGVRVVNYAREASWLETSDLSEFDPADDDRDEPAGSDGGATTRRPLPELDAAVPERTGGGRHGTRGLRILAGSRGDRR